MEEGISLWGILAVLFLIVINAIVSGAEAAIYNLNESNIKKKATKEEKSAKTIIKIINRPNNYLNVTQTIIVFISIAFITTEAVRYAKYFKMFLTESIEINTSVAGVISNISITFIMLYLLLLLGMLLPRKFAKKYADGYANATAGFVNAIVIFFIPIIKLSTLITNLFLKLIGIDPNLIEESVTEEEIMSMVNEGYEQGVILDSEAEMITNIFEFGDKNAGDIMTHRKKIIAIDIGLSLDEVVNKVLNESYSRFPLYEENIDNIVGILHLKDLMKHYVSDELRGTSLKDIARDAYLIPETQNLSILFRDMQSNKIHMAIAIDEYGQVAGLVAMEDILEEIVGSIMDEYDEEEHHIKIQEDCTYIMDGITPLEEVESILDISFEDNDFDTLNGFLISKLERIPAEDEKADILYEGYLFTIISVKDNVIHSINVSKESEKCDDINDEL